MLALTRKKGESLVINNNIEITVLEIRGDQVKIGISAPKEVPVYRKEVYLQIQNENKAALNATDAIREVRRHLQKRWMQRYSRKHPHRQGCRRQQIKSPQCRTFLQRRIRRIRICPRKKMQSREHS